MARSVLITGAGGRMIYFASDSIFDGRKGKYVEEDLPEPLHFYGQTKVQGEKSFSRAVTTGSSSGGMKG